MSALWSLLQLRTKRAKDNNGVAEFKSSLEIAKRDFKRPHATQIFAILFLFGFDRRDAWYSSVTNALFGSRKRFMSQVIQINTGEGKSIILGMMATLMALLGFGVDVVCYSKILSNRDAASFRDLFEELGVEGQAFYGTF